MTGRSSSVCQHMQVMEVATLITSCVAAIASLWTGFRLERLSGRVDAIERGHHAHLNSGLHTR